VNLTATRWHCPWHIDRHDILPTYQQQVLAIVEFKTNPNAFLSNPLSFKPNSERFGHWHPNLLEHSAPLIGQVQNDMLVRQVNHQAT
jgi:hypothetical protein